MQKGHTWILLQKDLLDGQKKTTSYMHVSKRHITCTDTILDTSSLYVFQKAYCEYTETYLILHWQEFSGMDIVVSFIIVKYKKKYTSCMQIRVLQIV